MAVDPTTVTTQAWHRPRTLATAVSDAMAALHRYYYGTEPSQIRAYVDGRFVVCVLVEPFTSYERELLAGVDGLESVRELWKCFQEAMGPRYKQAVAKITGQKVVAVLSDAHADPDLVVVLLELDGVAQGL